MYPRWQSALCLSAGFFDFGLEMSHTHTQQRCGVRCAAFQNHTALLVSATPRERARERGRPLAGRCPRRAACRSCVNTLASESRLCPSQLEMLFNPVFRQIAKSSNCHRLGLLFGREDLTPPYVFVHPIFIIKLLGFS